MLIVLLALTSVTTGTAMPACDVTVLAVALHDGEPVTYSSVRVVDSVSGDTVWEGKCDGAGVAVVPVRVSGRPSWIDVFMPGFEVSTAEVRCDTEQAQRSIIEMREINAFVGQATLAERSQNYSGERIGVCGSLDLGNNHTKLRLHDRRSPSATGDPVIDVVISGRAAERTQRRVSGYACVDGVFRDTPDGEYVGTLTVENIWWVERGDLTTP